VAKNKQQKDKIEKIELIQGQNRVLIIAPHGFNGDKSLNLKADDENTGLLAREIARRLGCYALINEVYKKPPRRKDPKTGDEKDVPDPRNKRINLNRINQVEKYLNGEFLTPIKEFTDEIVNKWGKSLVFWIHGIDNGNINKYSADGNPKEVHVLVGIGQGSPDRFTAEICTVNDLTELFKNNGRKPIVAKLAKRGSRYCGHHENIMNQIFLKLNYDLTKVQSIQLEIMYTGFRDPQNIYQTAG